MPKQTENYDFVVIGGGVFGVYAALYLAKKGLRICLVEKETALMKKASIVNQARLHGGYHYPRSIATARMSDENKARFTKDHSDFILFNYDKFYAIDKFGSMTDAAQFERFCNFIGIPCEIVEKHPLFNYQRLDAVFKTTEYTFDPILIANSYKEKIETEPNVNIQLNTRVFTVNKDGNEWLLKLSNGLKIKTPQVINATYSASNAVNEIFEMTPIHLMHEISEMCFVTSPQLEGIGLTIMDGPFGSIMPYGLSGLHSFSAVSYTHHKVSYEAKPTFDCQHIRQDCQPEATAICNHCIARPKSNYAKMKAQMDMYLSEQVKLHYFTSMFTIKSKLKANYIDDGRPTEIAVLHRKPHFYCIFAGKINSIYEIEKLIEL